MLSCQLSRKLLLQARESAKTERRLKKGLAHLDLLLKFFFAMADGGTFTHACRINGISITTAWRWRRLVLRSGWAGLVPQTQRNGCHRDKRSADETRPESPVLTPAEGQKGEPAGRVLQALGSRLCRLGKSKRL